MQLISRTIYGVVLATSVFALSRCKKETTAGKTPDSVSVSVPEPGLFTLMHPSQTHIDFVNTLTEGLNTNILMYEYFYNGGGVATGDFNGDSLIDIYFTSNMGGNKLYLNKGNMEFQDVTVASGAGGREGPWKTGVTIVDINGDNKLDLYVCYSGALPDQKRANQLFINNGNDEKGIPKFEEKAEAFGLASTAYSNQAYFFDYDRDGDLDMLLLNHNPNSLPVLNEVSTAEILKKDDPLKGVRLYRQNKSHFQDVTKILGISSSALTYGLGVGVADMNCDGWPDFYISNDYTVPDYLYINNHNGTFTDKLQECIGHNSQFSMGNEVADVNNDELPDIITLDMLPEDNYRQKLLLAPDNYGKFELNIRTGFYYQYMRNMLQLNNGNGTFSEIGQLAGISNTDWSWAPLSADYNNDGWKDLLVTNGYFRDYTNLDFIKYMDDFVKARGRLKRDDVLELVAHMPSSNVVNYIFANNDGRTFTNKTKAWGMNRPSNSNGAAYADLDNDGDLDIVVNNINEPAFLYRNESDKNPDNHFLQVQLRGEGLNTLGIGTKVSIQVNGRRQCVEQVSSRGYLSAVSPVLHFGLGKETLIDSLHVVWPDGREQLLTAIKADQVLTLDQRNAAKTPYRDPAIRSIFKEVSSPIKYKSEQPNLNDFKRQSLMINPMSFSGPCMVKGDVNADGLEDVFIGGVSGQAGALFIQQGDGKFSLQNIPAFEEDKMHDDVAAVFFDANGDGKPDLYVASGGYHNYEQHDALLQDRLYINDGKGNFSRAINALPQMYTSTGCVAVNDVDGDGDLDLFVGGRVVPGRYPEAPSSYLLVNDGKGHFTNAIKSIAPALEKFGMITDAVWTDINQDKKNDLVIVGEWLPVSVFINVNGTLKNETTAYFDKEYRGFWNKIVVADFNQDQKPDFIAGNMGTNVQFKVSDSEPAEIYYKDYDDNGSVDPIFCYYIQGKSYPFVTRDELLDQLSVFRSRYTTYKSYAGESLADIFKPEELKDFSYLQTNRMETSLFISTAGQQYKETALPVEAQYSPVCTITVIDYNKDAHDDLLLCGNINHAKLRLGKQDANYGVLLKGDGRGNFTYIDQRQSGFRIRGDVRSVVEVNNVLLFGIGQQPVTAYRCSK